MRAKTSSAARARAARSDDYALATGAGGVRAVGRAMCCAARTGGHAFAGMRRPAIAPRDVAIVGAASSGASRSLPVAATAGVRMANAMGDETRSEARRLSAARAHAARRDDHARLGAGGVRGVGTRYDARAGGLHDVLSAVPAARRGIMSAAHPDRAAQHRRVAGALCNLMSAPGSGVIRPEGAHRSTR